MSSTPPSGGRLFVEPLEARIAPTTLLANNVASKGTAGYIDYSTNVPGLFVSASSLGVAPNDPTVHALILHANDQLEIFNQGTGFSASSPFLQLTAGSTAIAFFKDKNGDGQIQMNELVGLALSKKSSAVVRGTIDGDVVTDVANDGSLMFTSAGTAGYKLTSLQVINGNINGNIISGGDMGSVAAGSIKVVGTVNGVLAGTAANGVSFNFTGTPGQVSGTISDPTYKDLKPGASILGLTINGVVPGGLIKAGDGGFGAVGGSVTNLNIQSDTDSFTVLGGTGGSGNATVKAGVGGEVNMVLINGVANSEVNHLISIQGGTGGYNPLGKAGIGGSVSQVATSFNVGFDFADNTGAPSATLLAQSISVHGGNGGDGLRGGAGGAVSGSNLLGAIPADGTPTPEIQVLGGDGGHDIGADGTGKGGAGGAVSGVTAENMDTLADANASSLLIQGGNGMTGKDGGGVSGVILLGHVIDVTAGNGGDSYATAGNGGSITNVQVTNLSNLFTSQLTLDSGQGGNAGAGNGGNGGSITSVNLSDADLTSLLVNTGTHGNGGSSQGAVGGAGGLVGTSTAGITLTDSGTSSFLAFTNPAPATVRAGTGGDGHGGGGAGGTITNFTMLGSGFAYSLTAGAGGAVTAGGTGNGGTGGDLNTVSVSNFLDVNNLSENALALTGSAVAGAGGAGTVAGGAGGNVVTVSLNAGATATLQAGNGGNGGSGAAGAGGSVVAASSGSGENSLFGQALVNAGDAGLTGAAAGAGGGINTFTSTAGTGIFMTAGNGHVGGAGGTISGATTAFNQLTNLPNNGNVVIRAGDGSAGNFVAGAGGNITGINGFVGALGSTTLTAGNGGGGDGQVKVGNGGSISGVNLLGTNDQFGNAVTVAFDAGSAGVSTDGNGKPFAKRGADGGSITGVVLSSLNENTVVHHFRAGDASSGINHGGTGGSVTQINVGVPSDYVADIGIRSGVAFGYNAGQSGGIFAGLAGTGAKSNGTSGSVSMVTARSISGIVAGIGDDPGLVNAIDSITLEGNVLARANADGSFANFDTANIVGSVYNGGQGPTAVGASTYKIGDGLVAVMQLPTNVNFTPEAELTLVNGQRTLIDNQQPNPPVTLPAPVNLQ